ncbi:MAG: heavy metal-associated domain-containing protein, partial [Acidimicrobiales bacterium]|nr:heavy metal-associated domain-containing protein [Acidimicrobiales bacterium]
MVTTVVLPVKGMTCGACSARVGRGLSELEGVDSATVNLATERATVVFDPGTLGVEVLRRAV